jgi:FMN phosphatase YigB (HAD superfamily)
MYVLIHVTVLLIKLSESLRTIKLDYGIDLVEYGNDAIIYFFEYKMSNIRLDSYVYGGIPLDDILSPDTELRTMLESIPNTTRKWILTNLSREQTGRVVHALGLQNLFQGVTSTFHDSEQRKPHRGVFKRAMKEAGISDVEKCWVVDFDSDTILTAKVRYDTRNYSQLRCKNCNRIWV